MSINQPLRFALAGLGGYAASCCDTLLKSPKTELLAVFEPNYAAHADRVAMLRERGVMLCDSYEHLTKQKVDAIWLPIPIDLHRPFTEQALAAGIAVLCEKPAAGVVQDVDAMILARDKTKLPVAIAYQHVCDPQMLNLKRRLLEKEFGRIKSISLAGCWPRSSAYYNRNDWAGKLKKNGRWVLDSPLANAMSHYLQLALFFAGSASEESAEAIHVEAELYRANEIENYDTCSVRLQTDASIPILVLMTHACKTSVAPVVHIRCEKADIRILPEQRVELKIGDRTESMPLSSDTRLRLTDAFFNYVRRVPESPTTIATLEMARAPLAVVNGVSMAAGIQTVDEQFVDVTQEYEGTLRSIENIESIFTTCERTEQMLSESKLATWAVKPGSMDMAHFREFTVPKMVS